MAPKSAHHGDPMQLHSSMQNALMAPRELAWPHCWTCLPHLRFHLRHVLGAFQPQNPLVSQRSDEKWAPFGGSRQNDTQSWLCMPWSKRRTLHRGGGHTKVPTAGARKLAGAAPSLDQVVTMCYFTVTVVCCLVRMAHGWYSGTRGWVQAGIAMSVYIASTLYACQCCRFGLQRSVHL
jgi:hypothetical protein